MALVRLGAAYTEVGDHLQSTAGQMGAGRVLKTVEKRADEPVTLETISAPLTHRWDSADHRACEAMGPGALLFL